MHVAERPTAISPGLHNFAPARLVYRIVCLAALLILELIALSIWLDTQALLGRSGLIGAIGDFGPHLLQSLVAFATVFLALGYANAKKALLPISESLADIPINWRVLAAHIGAMAVFAFLSRLLFGGVDRAPGNLVATMWVAAGVVGIATAVFFFVPPRTLLDSLRITGSAWVYAAAAACATPFFVIASKRLWKPREL